jgi:hypothetical protein
MLRGREEKKKEGVDDNAFKRCRTGRRRPSWSPQRKPRSRKFPRHSRQTQLLPKKCSRRHQHWRKLHIARGSTVIENEGKVSFLLRHDGNEGGERSTHGGVNALEAAGTGDGAGRVGGGAEGLLVVGSATLTSAGTGRLGDDGSVYAGERTGEGSVGRVDGLAGEAGSALEFRVLSARLTEGGEVGAVTEAVEGRMRQSGVVAQGERAKQETYVDEQ